MQFNSYNANLAPCNGILLDPSNFLKENSALGISFLSYVLIFNSPPVLSKFATIETKPSNTPESLLALLPLLLLIHVSASFEEANVFVTDSCVSASI